jgi:ABC-type transport system substrate-binding protein
LIHHWDVGEAQLVISILSGRLAQEQKRQGGFMKMKRFVVLCMIASLAIATVGIGVAAQQVLKISVGDLENVDPMDLGGRNPDAMVASLVCDNLVFLGKDDFLPKPELAVSWEAVDDLTWVFHLREGVMFQDGNAVFAEGESRELTADDVVYSIQRAKEVAAYLMLSEIDSATAIDRYTVEVKTTAPAPFLLDVHHLASVMIIPQEAVDQLGDDLKNAPIGSGPFELQTFLPGEMAVLVKNEDYWLDSNLDEVQFIVIPDPSAAVIALEAGVIDVISYGPADEGPRLLEAGFTVAGRGGSYRGVGFNVTTPPFDDYRVRRAISLALDVDSIWPAVIPADFGERAYGQVPPWVPMGFDSEGLKDLDGYDEAEALRLLADAGWTDSDADGWLDKDGEKLSFEMKCFDGTQVRVFTIIATLLQKLGIEATVLQQDVGVWVDDLLGGNTGMFFDFSYAGTTGLYSMFHSALITQSNTHFYSNAAVDLLLDQANTTVDYNTRSTLWKAAQRIIVEDQAIIPLYFEITSTYVASYVKDFVSEWGTFELISSENNVSVEK